METINLPMEDIQTLVGRLVLENLALNRSIIQYQELVSVQENTVDLPEEVPSDLSENKEQGDDQGS